MWAYWGCVGREWECDCCCWIIIVVILLHNMVIRTRIAQIAGFIPRGQYTMVWWHWELVGRGGFVEQVVMLRWKYISICCKVSHSWYYSISMINNTRWKRSVTCFKSLRNCVKVLIDDMAPKDSSGGVNYYFVCFFVQKIITPATWSKHSWAHAAVSHNEYDSNVSFTMRKNGKVEKNITTQ